MRLNFSRSKSKFNNVKTEVDGLRFDSKKEAQRYVQLRLRERIGEIVSLEIQPRFRLEVNGQKVCEYRADFRYTEQATGRVVVEDVKGGPTATPVYRLKKKLVKALHGIEVTEV